MPHTVEFIIILQYDQMFLNVYQKEKRLVSCLSFNNLIDCTLHLFTADVLGPQTHPWAETPPAAGACCRLGAGEAGVSGQGWSILPLRRSWSKQPLKHCEF